MKYYLIQIQSKADGTTVPGVYIYEDIDTAEASFHSRLSSDIKAEDVLATVVKVITNNGQEVFNEYWQKSVFPEVEETVD